MGQPVLTTGIHASRNLDLQLPFLDEIPMELVDIVFQDACHLRGIGDPQVTGVGTGAGRDICGAVVPRLGEAQPMEGIVYSRQ